MAGESRERSMPDAIVPRSKQSLFGCQKPADLLSLHYLTFARRAITANATNERCYFRCICCYFDTAAGTIRLIKWSILIHHYEIIWFAATSFATNEISTCLQSLVSSKELFVECNSSQRSRISLFLSFLFSFTYFFLT